MEMLVNFVFYLANSIAVFIGAYVGLLKEDKIAFNLTKKIAININKRQLLVSLFVCVLLSFLLSFERDSISGKKLSEKDRQHDISDSIRDDKKYKQISQLESQHTQEMIDALFASDEKHSRQLQNNTDSFLRIFAKYNTNNEKEHKTTQSKIGKIDSIRTPHLQPYVTGDYKKDSILGTALFPLGVTNTGNGIAFDIELYYECIFLRKADSKLHSYGRFRLNKKKLSLGITQSIFEGVIINNYESVNIDTFWVILQGNYTSENKEKFKIDDVLEIYYDKQTINIIDDFEKQPQLNYLLNKMGYFNN